MIRKLALGLGLVIASSAAHAMEVAPIQAASLTIGQATGVAYYTVEATGYHVVATLAAGYG